MMEPSGSDVGGGDIEIGPATAAETDALASIWYLGWLDGHADSVADELVAMRTAEEFSRRMTERIEGSQRGVVVARRGGEAAGFIMVVADELEQIYVGRNHRGAGIAQLLLAAAEQEISAAGHAEAWLAVVAGNDRARAFYAKHGWRDGGLFNYEAAGVDGPIAVPSHRYVKTIA